MIDRPTEADAMAAVARGDYEWLVKHVFIPAMALIMREERTAALMNGPRPRTRRPAGTHGRRHNRTRSSKRFRPKSR